MFARLHAYQQLNFSFTVPITNLEENRNDQDRTNYVHVAKPLGNADFTKIAKCSIRWTGKTGSNSPLLPGFPSFDWRNPFGSNKTPRTQPWTNKLVEKLFSRVQSQNNPRFSIANRRIVLWYHHDSRGITYHVTFNLV